MVQSRLQAEPESLSDQLRAAIKKSGLSICKLSKLAGVNKSMVARFVSGERDVRSETFGRIAAVLGLTLCKRSGRG